MGLQAIVYKNLTHIREVLHEEACIVDPATAEPSVESRHGQTLPRHWCEAVSKRLGNIGEIDHLRSIIEEYIGGRHSILLGKVLYSGTHSGDTIPPADLSKLKEEIALLTRTGEGRLVEFLESMTALIAAAEEEGNPIVFV